MVCSQLVNCPFRQQGSIFLPYLREVDVTLHFRPIQYQLRQRYMTAYDVIVVGGGPAGLMAAGQAARCGSTTLLMEKNTAPGVKLLLTGKGRCNLSNTAPIDEALQHFNREGRFLTQCFYQFFTDDLRGFFHDLEIPTVVQRGGRVFPASENSRDVLGGLLRWVKESGVNLQLDTSAEALIIKEGRMRGLSTSRGEYSCQRLILATGGKSYPGTGSTGDGYSLASSAGHHITHLSPALVPLVTAGKTARQLQGLSLKNAAVSTWVNGRKGGEIFGELLFTHFGLSGPVILTLSRSVVLELETGNQVELRIDLKPALDHSQLDDRLLRDIVRLGRKQFSTLLEGLLPKALIPVCLEQTGIERDLQNSQLSGEQRKRLVGWLKDGFKFNITGHRGFRQAVITAGGVDTGQVNPRTMESILVPGLYFAGEILDVDADTGGYNLQAAFSTGWAAGKAAGGCDSS
jgi:predicted Rossmann fold flavoprotein